MDKKQKFGQYFTTDKLLKNKVCEFIVNQPQVILEPSVGQGDLVMAVREKWPNMQFDMYEIDNTLKNNNTAGVVDGDFLAQKITKTYKTIIGNPPYVRTKNGNLYVDFVRRCVELLEDNGELIFIVPADFLKLTCAAALLCVMMSNGTFTHIYHPHNEKLFEGASIDVIVFRYQKSPELPKKVIYNDKEMFVVNNAGMITFNEQVNVLQQTLQSYFDMYVGIVSGKDEIFKNAHLGNISVINGENKVDKYVLVEKMPSGNQAIDDYLMAHKAALMGRKIRKFNNENWFEWGALRNVSAIRANEGKDCIYVYNLTRRETVAFVGKVGYFGGGLIMLLPKGEINLRNVVNHLNSSDFKKDFLFAGRFKIGHRTLSNSQFLKI